MRLLQTMAPSTGFRDPADNPRRLDVLEELLNVAAEHAADLILLPGGYLTVPNEQDVTPAYAEIGRRALAANVTVVAGVDCLPASGKEPKGATARGKRARSADLPYFGFGVGPVVFECEHDGPWRQTSSTRENARDVADEDVPGAERVFRVGSQRVGVLICGELFSERARQSLSSIGLDLVLDLGHIGMGTGVTRAMENIARNGRCAVAHAHHVAGWGGQSLHFVARTGVRESIPLDNCRWVGDEEFWSAWHIRTI